jgi:hypothetical protein
MVAGVGALGVLARLVLEGRRDAHASQHDHQGDHEDAAEALAHGQGVFGTSPHSAAPATATIDRSASSSHEPCENLYKFVVPAVAGPARLVPLPALATERLSADALTNAHDQVACANVPSFPRPPLGARAEPKRRGSPRMRSDHSSVALS